MSSSCLLPWVLVCCLFTGHLDATTPRRKHKTPAPAAEQNAEAKALPKTEDSPEPLASPAQASESSRKASAVPNATVPTAQIVEFGGELLRVRKLIESVLVLTTQDLTYSASDDPSTGGMDCSGFVSYVLKKNGFADVPRDASGQYSWLRKAGTFRAVLSQNGDTFELDELRPGDLLFWTGTYVTSHDPPVTHSMIYLGTEKGTANRIMGGSSNGRSYHGKTRWGVSVFDFHLNGSSSARDGKQIRSTFVGYARPPGLRD